MSSKRSEIAVIAAGGSGGHIFPGIAIANAVQSGHPDLKIQFMGAKGGMEEALVPKAGFPLRTVSIGRFNRNVNKVERLLTLIRLPFAILKCVALMLYWRPRFVLGVGGHASVPVLLAAAITGRKTFVWEPNAVPGMANRLLSRFVDEALVVLPEAKPHFGRSKVKDVGMPIRQEIENLGAVSKQEFSKQGLKVFVFGGSQGARGINLAMVEMLRDFPSELQGFEFVHQTGKYDSESVQRAYKDISFENLEVLPFIDNMSERYQWADVVVSRSGMATIAELAATQKPSLLIPLPTSADNHQQKNAESLKNKGAAQMLLQADLSGESLKNILLSFLHNSDELLSMQQNVRSFYVPSAADKIADYVMEETNL